MEDHLSATSTPLGGLSTAVPLVLLPVRLETRFVGGGGGTQLLVRIYPDDLHADSHEPGLTESEIVWAQHFWVQTWLAGGSAARQHAAWRQLAEQFGAPRAAYVADTLLPTNPQARPTDPAGVKELSTPPAFPSVGTPRQPGWTRPPYTRVLPDSWVAVGYAAGQRFVHRGAGIPDPLALGPTLDVNAGGVDAEHMASDPNAGWLTDFGAAERVGMALRIPFPAPEGTPLDRLLVFGVKAGLSAAAGEERLLELLRAHRYVEGLGFVPQGTPSNNMGDAPSGYNSLDAAVPTGPLADAAAAAFRPGDGSNADVVARSLVGAPAFLARLPFALEPEQREAYHMNTVLWKATWGYFLEQLMAGPGSPSDDAIRRGREHFASYVRARGPLPALRIGQQPYGILPAMSLDRWTPLEGGPIDLPVMTAIRGLREVWRRALPAVPRVPGALDRETALVNVLGMQPVASHFVARPAQPVVPIGATSTASAMGSAALRQLAATLGLTWSARQLRTLPGVPASRFPLASAPIEGTLPEALSESRALDPNYLALLNGAAWDAVRTETTGARPGVLLYVLTRHAMLREYVGAAFRILQVPPGERGEPDGASSAARTPSALLGTAPTRVTAPSVGSYLDTVKQQLRREMTQPAASGATWQDGAAAGAIWRRNLYDVAAAGAVTTDVADDLREFAALVRGVESLAARPTAALGRLLPETLDLAAHRLDAWATSFATKRLEWLRSRTPRGLALGGFGWVENVVPVPRTAVTPPTVPPGTTPPPPELAAPLYASPANKGYVQAPSLAHATTAAVLRSGYLSRRASGDGGVLAVNLSSQRVRTARWLLDGIRGGQSLSALLGYRFERGLHENHPTLILDRYIPTFRALAPQPGDLPMPPQVRGAVEAIAARNVVDGLALLQRYRAAMRTQPPASRWTAATIPFGASVPPLEAILPPADAANREFGAILAELRGLDDAVDAISDLTVAEAVHQVAQGNAERAGAALEAIALGEAPPPELQVIETPRTGMGLTHRLAVLFGGVPAPSWGADTPRSQAEPQLASWVAQLLGPGAPGAVGRVTYVDAATDQPLLDPRRQPYRRDVSLAELGMGPLDVLYLPESEGDAQASELEQRIAYRAMQAAPEGVRPADVPETAALRLTFSRQPDWPAETLGMAEVLEAARAARRLVTSARALAPADLALPDAAIPAGADADDAPADERPTAPERPLRLSYRADTAVAAFRTAARALIDAVLTGDGQTIAPEAARPLLLRVAAFGVGGAVPLSPADAGPDARATLHTQAQSVAREVAARVRRIDAVEAAYVPASASPAATRDHHLTRLREVFGQEFRVLPRFSASDGATLARTFAASAALQGGTTLEAITWMQRAARVRDGVARFDTTLMYAEALGTARLNLTVGQLPYADRDRWVALPHDAAGMPGGRLSLVAHSPTPINATAPLAGLLVDEWVEVVPSAVETTGLAFHFDRPSARAPQTVLVAVAPDGQPTWDLESLEATLTETLELAKLRAVDSPALAELGGVLPAVYLSNAPTDQTVSSDLGRLAGPGGAA